MNINDPLYVDGSVTLLQTTGTTPTVFYVDGSMYVVHEYVAGEPPVGAIMNQFQRANLGADLFNGTLL